MAGCRVFDGGGGEWVAVVEEVLEEREIELRNVSEENESKDECGRDGDEDSDYVPHPLKSSFLGG